MSSIILYSGGMDSTVLLYQYRKDIKLAVTFDYGGRHNKMEYDYAKQHTKQLGIPHIKINLDFMLKYFKSSLLLSGDAIPDGHYEDAVMKQTVVPFRNGIMLSIAAGIAESNDMDTILISNHAGDHAIYPDCRENFITSMNEAIHNGTYNNVKILAPYTRSSKRDIAIFGHTLNVPFEDTYSCYKGGEIHCGVCGTCVERKEALEGFDKTRYLKF